MDVLEVAGVVDRAEVVQAGDSEVPVVLIPTLGLVTRVVDAGAVALTGGDGSSLSGDVGRSSFVSIVVDLVSSVEGEDAGVVDCRVLVVRVLPLELLGNVEGAGAVAVAREV